MSGMVEPGSGGLIESQFTFLGLSTALKNH